MVDALRARGRRCEYVAFAGEGHGFRRAETLERRLEAELDFYRGAARRWPRGLSARGGRGGR